MVEEKSPMFNNKRRREMKAFAQMVSYGTCPFQVGQGISLARGTDQGGLLKILYSRYTFFVKSQHS